MKKFLFFLFVIWMMATTGTQAQTRTISFVNQNGCNISYEVDTLVSIITTSDTLVDDDESIRLLNAYETKFPSNLGPNELAFLILVPDDDYFDVIFMQETKTGKIKNICILSSEGWLEVCPHQRKNLRQLAKKLRE